MLKKTYNPDNPATTEIETYDPAPMLTRSMLAMAFMIVLFLGGIVLYQIVVNEDHVADTASWGQFALLAGWLMAKVSDIIQHRFGTNKQSAQKDETIARQAQTAATIARQAQTAATIAKTAAGTGNGGTEPDETVDSMTVAAGKVTVNPPAPSTTKPTEGKKP